ncbi:MAG: MmgE/PrpD family protein [Deltaproteobacteria bacterium]|nr:MmgE/PrpD family protein [Deltaproteobacteria bacterium]
MNQVKHRTVTEDLSEYVSQAAKVDLPARIIGKAKDHILDTIAAMVSGARLEPGRLVTEYIRRQQGIPEAQLVGSEVMTTAGDAALANGIMAHADETDDSHAPSMTHPGCAVIPAALAMAEKEGCDGKTFLNAVVLGYDVGCRVSLALVPSVYRRSGFCSHSIGGTFGAAAAAACIAGFDAVRVSHALSYAGHQASGVGAYVRCPDHLQKAFVFGGMPARNGVTAATLVQAGFTGVSDIFLGERNFLDAYSSDPKIEELTLGLGSRYEIERTNIKKFFVGSPIQAALDALLQITAEHELKASDVERLMVRLPEREARTVNDRHMPDINLQYILAVTLLDGKLSFESAHCYERMTDARVLEMKSRIELQPDPDLGSEDAPRQAIVEVATRDGRNLRTHVKNVRGTAADPMTQEEVINKARDLISAVIGKQKCERLIEMVRGIEDVADIRDFRPLLRT